MTILPKKKQNKNTNDDDRDKDHSNERYNYGQINSANQNGQISPNNRVWTSRNEDKRSAPDSDCSTDHSLAASSHLKRRHRNRERDVNSDHQRSIISSVRNKSINSSSNSSSLDLSLNLNNTDNDLAIPGCSGIIERKENEINHSSIRGPVLSEDEDEKKDISGYNSGDEYQKTNEHRSNIDWEEKERIFDRKIRKKGFIIKKMCEDGACLFRAVGKHHYYYFRRIK